MTKIELTNLLKRDGQLTAALYEPVKGCVKVKIAPMNARSNPHDFRVSSINGKRTLGRINLGSKNLPACFGDWPLNIKVALSA